MPILDRGGCVKGTSSAYTYTAAKDAAASGTPIFEELQSKFGLDTLLETAINDTVSMYIGILPGNFFKLNQAGQKV